MTDDNKQDKKPGLLTLPWFRPLYRRVILIAIVVAWCAWDWFYTHDGFWQLITLAALGYGVWIFFINFENELKKADDGKPKS